MKNVLKEYGKRFKMFKTWIKNNIAIFVMIVLVVVVAVFLFRISCKKCSPVGEPGEKTDTVSNNYGMDTLVLSGILAVQETELNIRKRTQAEGELTNKENETQDFHTAEEENTEGETVFEEKGYTQIYCAVYDDADKSADIIGYLYYGTPVMITESKGQEFWQISFDNGSGFVQKDYLTVEEPQSISTLFNTFKRTDLPDGVQTDTAYINNFPVVLQNPNLPSGCEVTSLAMVLNYWGFEVTNRYLADYCLPAGSRGDNIFNKFIGSVYDNSSYGCYANALSDCAAAYSEEYRVANISGAKLDELCQYVASGYPVIVWATESMKESGAGDLWMFDGVPMGYLKNEHCLVMIGYDKINDMVVLADPLVGEKQYSLSTFYQRYCSQYMQAVLLY